MPTLRTALTCLIAGLAIASLRTGPISGQAPARKKLLFLTHAALYKHSSLAPAEAAITELGTAGGFDVTTLEGYKQDSAKLDMSFLTPEYLSQFDGLMLMTNGNLPLTDTQKRAVVAQVPLGKSPEGVYISHDGSMVSVAVEENNSITLVDTASGKAIADIPVKGKNPEHAVFSPDGA